MKVTLEENYYEIGGAERLLEQFLFREPIDSLEIDFGNLRWIELGPLVFLLGLITKFRNQDIPIRFLQISGGRHSYLSRINFFTRAGCAFNESFTRRPALNRFVEIQMIDSVESHLVDSLSEKIAACMAGTDIEIDFTDTASEDGYYEALAYSVSELIKNVQQHSQGQGFIAAQYYPRSGKTHIAIVDNGIGIWNSFTRSGSPHASGMKSNLDAIGIALKPEVSSKTHSTGPFGTTSENAGVGLTLLTDIATQVNGFYQVISGDGYKDSIVGKTLRMPFQGTFICLCFDRDALRHFGQLLEVARTHVYGASPSQEIDFNGLFEED
jgi:hypothetical protein